MGKSLVIVESPAKARTINKFLGKDFVVKASIGHIKDLPENKLGVDIENRFRPQYVVIKGKKKIIEELKRASRDIKEIYLAPDPDREGEAIAWHIAEELGNGGKRIYRALIHEITPQAVIKAIKNPRELQESLYQAQQARRILDRLVGYKISPLLWQKVKRGLSAGRVQSVALRLICDREREVRDFVPQEYWTITALLQHPQTPPPFEAKLTQLKGEKVKISNEKEANGIIDGLGGKRFVVEDVVKKEKKRYPSPPFITSTLQQEASRKLRFSAKRTMLIAQQLYEGVDLGEWGRVGLITYMRTDSVRLSQDAVRGVRELIRQRFGEDYLPAKPNHYKSRPGAQEAHEAVRPTSLDLPPEKVKGYLTPGQWSLYKLIWERFIACQMHPALFDQTTIKIRADDHLFLATGSVMKFSGFRAVYVEGKDYQEGEEEGGILPPLNSGQELELLALTPKQHFTQPPPRFTESTLVRELEEKGIGRPSTYATILSTVQEKRYVKLIERKFHPTELGSLVTDLLSENFPTIMDVGFTAQLEENLDKIEEQKVTWIKVLEEFYTSFEENLRRAGERMRDVKRERTPTEIICDQCGSKMEIRWGKYGEFLSCSAYPECKNAKMFTRDGEGKIMVKEAQSADERCPLCGSPMLIKEGKYGRFLACSKYPDCKGTKPLSTGVRCPQQGCGGELVQRRTKKGKIFYSCSNYPQCRFALWERPIPRPCPRCGAPFLVERRSKEGTKIVCKERECNYQEEKD
ncbi:MAG: type I DNA topoisomerase [Deltaproteobacteria bacterium]|nr:type I DNA topoisomerase [Deltaproteobacteria bacterium]